MEYSQSGSVISSDFVATATVVPRLIYVFFNLVHIVSFHFSKSFSKSSESSPNPNFRILLPPNFSNDESKYLPMAL